MGNKRFEVMLPEPLAEELERLRREKFRDKTPEEMVRYLIIAGLESSGIVVREDEPNAPICLFPGPKNQ